ncbi:TPA: hypothetical protein N0F65_004420 [Lagenidium giganteum]|uniref:HTH-like domain-containing protein n=1 Tax=Lagenidium giganteum TaxID=4803 RepID=A0AAV2ZBJ8_9STRA|nr:TPA: hypothetical protein N0F65_004420 [Lagenidium giganteum]
MSGSPRAGTTTQSAAAVAEDSVEGEELIALIKAIKFAYADYGCKRVTEEIHTHGGKYAKVPLKRVKKYMQKLGMTNNNQSADDAAPEATQKSETSDLRSKAQKSSKQGAIQLMTVGGKSKSKRSGAAADNAGSSTSLDSVWLPVKLDEPASKTKDFPYQAVIRMTDSDEGDAHGDMGEIYKIQVALGMNNELSATDPMLVYNKARDRKTFLHPDSPAYAPVQRLIVNRGLNGAVGGSKAYFWGRYQKADDMLYINTEKLAAFQKW